MPKPRYDEDSCEFGEFLPEDEAQLFEESERIRAFNGNEAKRKCEELAQDYNGTDSSVEPVSRQLFDCNFKVWRS